MSKGIGITELTTLLTANPRMVGAIREQEKVGFLSTMELEALLAGSVGTADITAGALTADVAGRAKVANGFFDNSVVAKFADGLFADDAASRLKFADLMVINEKLATPRRREVISIPVDYLVGLLVGGGEIATNFVPGFAGRVEKISFITSTPGTSAGAPGYDLTVEIGAAAITGGVLTLALAATTALGQVEEATAVTHDGGEEFSDTDTLSILYSASAAFTAGSGAIVIVLGVEGQ